MKRLFALVILLIEPQLHADPSFNRCYPVGDFHIIYDPPHPSEVPVSDLMMMPIDLHCTPDGFIAMPTGSDWDRFCLYELNDMDKMGCYSRSALQAICNAIAERLKACNLSGLTVQIDPRQISPSGKDLRGPNASSLTIVIRLAVVGEVGTIKLTKDCLTPSPCQDSDRSFDYILINSPNQPSACGVGDLFSKDKLDSYLYYLNRHPNRRVDARIYSLYQDNRIGIDYLVSENKPWQVYFSAGNTGNDVTGIWQETFGFYDTQVTGVDDIINLSGTTDNSSFFTVAGSYERPLPFWDRACWKLFTMFNRYAAADLGFEDKIFVGIQGIGHLIFKENVYQNKDFFIDITQGLRYYYIEVTNRFFGLDEQGTQQFVAPTLSFHMDQFQDLWRFSFDLEGLMSPNGFLTSNRKEMDLMGRFDSSRGFGIINMNFFTSFYVTPPKPVHQFAFNLQAQCGFNFRLIPQLKYVVGGFNTVRGYTEAVNSGDSALLARGEYLFHLPPIFCIKPCPTKLFGKTFRSTPTYPNGRADWDFIVRFFIDAARSIDNKRIELLEANSTLVSTGFGAEIDLWQNLMVRLDWAVALKEVQQDKLGHNVLYFNSTIAY